jgi:flagellar biosynthesis protein FlhF
MPDALALVKRELGPDAVILGTRTLTSSLGRIVGRERVEITASAGAAARPAVATAAAAPVRTGQSSAKPAAPLPGRSENREELPKNPPQLPESVYPYYVSLVRSEVEASLAERVAQAAARSANGKDETAVRTALRGAIAAMVPAVGGIELTNGACRRVALIGPPGGGKTTTIAKLAAHFGLRMRKRVALVSFDTHRPGTHDQTRRYAELIGVPAVAAQTVSGVREALQRLPESDLVLIDTPGVGWRDRGRFARLAALLRAARPDEVHLTLPASLSARVQQQAAQTFAPLGVSRLVLTRLDEAVGLGAVLNVIDRLSIGVSYLAGGQRVPTDLEEAQRERLAELVLAS